MSLTPSSSAVASTSSSGIERSLNRQVVLEEDEYTEALSRIIARDFFPSLVHLDATNEYLDALRTKDPSLIQASVRRLQEVQDTPTTHTGRTSHLADVTPRWAGETPLRTPREDDRGSSSRPPKRRRYNSDLSLDEFQARYTSEDNSSFTHILDDENRQRKEKYGWAWDAQKRADEKTQKVIEQRERMLIEPAPVTGMKEKFMIEPAEAPKGLITAGGEEAEDLESGEGGKCKVVATIEKVDGANGEVDVMAKKKDTRVAVVDGWKFKNRNSLMFSPDADASPYHGPTGHNPIVKDPKSITHGSTRLIDEPSTSTRSQSVPPSPTHSRIDAAIMGTPYRPRSPTINSFSLVPNLPSPTPAELGPKAVNQLMTWGKLTATPRIISSEEDPVSVPDSPFHIRDISSREVISHRLSNKASKSLRAKADMMGFGGRTPGGKKTSMPPPSSTRRRSDAPGNLTPAARRLLDRSTLGTAAARRAEVMGMRWETKEPRKDMNQVRWTPTPGR